VLVSILLPALNSAREHARTLQCLGNLKSIGTALHMYAGENNGFITQEYNEWTPWIPGDWPEKLGPYLGLGRDPGECRNNMVALMCSGAQIKIDAHSYIEQVEAPYYHGGYAFNALLDGYIWEARPPKQLHELDSDLVFLGDGMLWFSGWWCMNKLLAYDPSGDYFHHPDYRHNGGHDRGDAPLEYASGDTANFLFLDGHGRSVTYDQRYSVALSPR